MSTEPPPGVPEPARDAHPDHRAFDAFAMREVDDTTIDAAIADRVLRPALVTVAAPK